jgi:hypothetical protein
LVPLGCLLGRALRRNMTDFATVVARRVLVIFRTLLLSTFLSEGLSSMKGPGSQNSWNTYQKCECGLASLGMLVVPLGVIVFQIR